MKWKHTELAGVEVAELEPHEDERGFFASLFSASAYREAGRRADLNEISLSRNARAGTLRGMHFQHGVHGETKLVRVVRGAAFDVVVDVRAGSPTFGRWAGFELSANNARAVYIPKGFAHGFLTLEDDTDVLYQITPTYCPEAARGFRWDDPVVGIPWPQPPVVVSVNDASLPLLAELDPE